MYWFARIISRKGFYFASMSSGSFFGFEANVSMAWSGELPVGLYKASRLAYEHQKYKMNIFWSSLCHRACKRFYRSINDQK